MATVRIVPALEPLEEGHPRLGPTRKTAAIQDLAFEGGEEALGHRIIVRIAGGPHGRHHASFAAALAERVAGVLGESIPRHERGQPHCECKVVRMTERHNVVEHHCLIGLTIISSGSTVSVAIVTILNRGWRGSVCQEALNSSQVVVVATLYLNANPCFHMLRCCGRVAVPQGSTSKL